MSEFNDFPPANVSPPANNTWKWILLACLLPVFGLICCCGGGATLFMSAMSTVKTSQTYTEAVRRAEADPRVRELLGEPITPGFSVTSNYNEVNGVGEMKLQVPLTGPKGTATLDAKSDNKGGAWKYSELQVRPTAGEAIDLRTVEERGGELLNHDKEDMEGNS